MSNKKGDKSEVKEKRKESKTKEKQRNIWRGNK
jgi:hypothetical protein